MRSVASLLLGSPFPGSGSSWASKPYRHAIDTLRTGDIAVLTTNAYCRQTHLDYAVEKGVNVFMEKSFAPDPGGLRRMLRAGEAAKAKNLKIATGLMCRHSVARQAFINKVRDGELGDVQLIRAYRMGPSAHLDRRNPQGRQSELEWQIRNKTFFYWVSSGRLIEYLIHQIDECCWLKGRLAGCCRRFRRPCRGQRQLWTGPGHLLD